MDAGANQTSQPTDARPILYPAQVLKLARASAGLVGSEGIQAQYLAEALKYNDGGKMIFWGG